MLLRPCSFSSDTDQGLVGWGTPLSALRFGGFATGWLSRGALAADLAWDLRSTLQGVQF